MQTVKKILVVLGIIQLVRAVRTANQIRWGRRLVAPMYANTPILSNILRWRESNRIKMMTENDRDAYFTSIVKSGYASIMMEFLDADAYTMFAAWNENQSAPGAFVTDQS